MKKMDLTEFTSSEDRNQPVRPHSLIRFLLFALKVVGRNTKDSDQTARTVLQIRGGIEDNSKIIFLIFQ